MNPPATQKELEGRFAGLLLGTAVGDALGLPAEGMSPQRIQRLWGGLWRHRFLFGGGMISDDTEHSLFVAQALLAHPDDAAAFERCLAWKLRLWLLGAPAGIGLATLKALLKLWAGFPPARSGIRSAGNGPAMRSAIVGAYFADDSASRKRFVGASTRLTHTDSRAETAALAIAEAAASAVMGDTPHTKFLMSLPDFGDDPEWKLISRKIVDAISAQASVPGFAKLMGLDRGVTGYAYHSVPVALYAWLRHPHDYRAALESALNCGGDTDTVAAMVGAICGAARGPGSIPSEWTAHLREWPRSPAVLTRVASRLAEQRISRRGLGPVPYFWPALILRNLIFAITVLGHGLRRALPPY